MFVYLMQKKMELRCRWEHDDVKNLNKFVVVNEKSSLILLASRVPI